MIRIINLFCSCFRYNSFSWNITCVFSSNITSKNINIFTTCNIYFISYYIRSYITCRISYCFFWAWFSKFTFICFFVCIESTISCWYYIYISNSFNISFILCNYIWTFNTNIFFSFYINIFSFYITCNITLIINSCIVICTTIIVISTFL